MQCNAACNQQRLGSVTRAESNACRNAFREIMDRNGHDKQQYLVQTTGMVAFNIRANQFVHMRSKLIDEAQAQRSNKNARHRIEKPPLSAVLNSRKNKPQYCRCQHHACGKRQDNVREFVRNIAEDKAQKRTDQRCAANAKGSQKYELHVMSSLNVLMIIYLICSPMKRQIPATKRSRLHWWPLDAWS